MATAILLAHPFGRLAQQPWRNAMPHHEAVVVIEPIGVTIPLGAFLYSGAL